MLDAVEEPLDQVACTVQHTVVVALCLAIRTRRDHDLCAGSPNPLHEVVSIVALVCDNRSGAQMLDQLRGTRDVGDCPSVMISRNGRPFESTARCSLALSPSACGPFF